MCMRYFVPKVSKHASYLGMNIRCCNIHAYIRWSIYIYIYGHVPFKRCSRSFIMNRGEQVFHRGCTYIYSTWHIRYICIYGHVPFSPCSGKVTRFIRFAVGAGPLRAPPGLFLAGPLWALVGRALVGPLGCCGPGPCGPPGRLRPRPLWAPWAPGPLWTRPLWPIMGAHAMKGN